MATGVGGTHTVADCTMYMSFILRGTALRWVAAGLEGNFQALQLSGSSVRELEMCPTLPTVGNFQHDSEAIAMSAATETVAISMARGPSIVQPGALAI